MKGVKVITVRDRKVQITLRLLRSVTIIKGDSGTGKSTLVENIRTWLDLGKEQSAVRITSNVSEFYVLQPTTDYESVFNKVRNGVVFVDEYVPYVTSDDFMRCFKGSDCYIVIVSRSNLFKSLPYSVHSIFHLSTVNKSNMFYTELSYPYVEDNYRYKPDLVITEDTNSGCIMMRTLFDCKVIPAGGNGNITKLVEKNRNNYKKIFIVVDGAVFGGFLAEILWYLNEDVRLFAPESFEYLVLRTKTFNRYLNDELNNTYNYADTLKYLTWEQYYTSLLSETTKQYMNFSYIKSKLHKYFLREDFINELKLELRDIDWD